MRYKKYTEYKKKCRLSLFIICCILSFVAAFFISYGWNIKYPATNRDSVSDVKDGILEVHYIDVGQGDCTLIKCGDKSMLIDAGDNDKGTLIQNYLQKQGISRLDYVIATHPDSDHIGSMDVILYKFPCDTVIMTDVKRDTRTYRDVIKVIEDKQYKVTRPQVGDVYKLGDAEFTILAPVSEYKDVNNTSIGIRLTYGNNSFVFTGDGEGQAEKDILTNGMNLDCDVYKVAHHGSKDSTSKEFLNAMSPAYAVISCGADNSYGHPHSRVLKELSYRGIEVFRTDEDGTVIAVSDGSSIQWSTEK